MEILGRRVVEFLDELPLVPAACILLVSRCTEYADAKKDEIKGLVTAVKGCLPNSCPLVGCVGAGVIGTGEGGFSEEVEMAEGVALMLMPQIEGVSAEVINLNLTEVKNNRTFKSRWEKSLKIPTDGTVKCAFLLAKGDTYHLDVIGKVASGIWKVKIVCNLGVFTKFVVLWIKQSAFEPWLQSLNCLLGEGTYYSEVATLHPSVYVGASKLLWQCGGDSSENLQWTNISSRGINNYSKFLPCH